MEDFEKMQNEIFKNRDELTNILMAAVDKFMEDKHENKVNEAIMERYLHAYLIGFSQHIVNYYATSYTDPNANEALEGYVKDVIKSLKKSVETLAEMKKMKVTLTEEGS